MNTFAIVLIVLALILGEMCIRDRNRSREKKNEEGLFTEYADATAPRSAQQIKVRLVHKSGANSV